MVSWRPNGARAARSRARYLACLLLVLALAVPGLGWAARERADGRVRVVYDDPALDAYAGEVLRRAGRALDLAEALFEARVPSLTVTLDGRDDLFNAVALPLPRPTAALRARFPVDAAIGRHAPDPLLLLLLHEAVHTVHFTGRGGSVPLRIGLAGERLPWPPPAWLLEGLAVWAESRLLPGPGGRLEDPAVRGLLRTLAADGPWPSLEDASLLTHAAWPGGRTRYLLGGAFVAHFIDAHGREAFLDALRAYETGPVEAGFADAWRRRVGTDLRAEWGTLRAALASEADDAATRAERLPTLGADPGELASPVPSPDGTRLAWSASGAIRVAPWREGDLGTARTFRLGGAPGRLAWWDDTTLVYARVAARPARRTRELFALHLDSGRERSLTDGARAFLPAPLPDGCLAYVRDAEPEGASLRRWCRGDAAGGPWIRPPRGTRIVGLDAAPDGRLVAVLWRAGTTRLALLEDGAFRALPLGLDRVAEPRWIGADALTFRAVGPNGVPEAYRLARLGGEARLTRLTRTVGGVRAPAAGVAVETRGEGRVLVRLPDDGRRIPTGPAAPPVAAPPRPTPTVDPADLGAGAAPRRYDPGPDLAPFGWLPTATAHPGGGTLGATLLARDALGRHGWEARLGVTRPGGGPLGPVVGGVRYRFEPNDAFRPVRRPAPLSASAGLGLRAFRPHRGEPLGPVPMADAGATWTAARGPTVRLNVDARLLRLPGGPWRAGARAGVVTGAVAADAWGAPLRGWRADLTAVADPSPGGHATGAWLDGRAWRPGPWGAVWSVGARGGVRAPAPVPAAAWGELAASVDAAAAWTVPVRARLGDGRYALERLRLQPRATVLGGDGGWAAAGSATVAADLVVGYVAPASLRASVGITSDGEAWWRLGVAAGP